MLVGDSLEHPEGYESLASARMTLTHLETREPSSRIVGGQTRVKYLEITTKNGLGRRTVELREKPLRIGRSHGNDVILRDTRVSRHHCVIEIVNGKPIVRDLGSSRGIKINNRRREESDLRPGDRVRIGPFMIVLREERGASNDVVPNGSAQPLNGWGNTDESADNDATAAGGEAGLDLAADSRGDSDLSEESSAAPDVDPQVDNKLAELAQQIERLESAARKREEAMQSLRQEMQSLQERASALQANAVAASGDNEGRVAAHAVKNAIEAEHASMTSALNFQRRELTDLVEERSKQLKEQATNQASELQARVEKLESESVDAAAGERLESSEQRLTDAADRLDQLATNHEQLAFEHSQVAGAAQDLAGRLTEVEEVSADLKSAVDRITGLEETAHQNAINARHALEHSTQFASKIEQIQQVAQTAETQAADIALNQAENAAQIAAHEETIHHGSQQVVRVAKLVDEVAQSQRASSEERSKLTSEVAELGANLVQLRESFADLQRRFESNVVQGGAHAESHDPELNKKQQKEVSALRSAVEDLGKAVMLRLERLESTTSEAGPQLDAVREQIHRLAATSHQAATPAPAAKSKAVARAKSPAGPAQSIATSNAPSKARPVSPIGIPSSLDVEQSRQVMSRIFAPKDEHDERYKPIRDHSTIAIVVFVLVLGLAVTLVMLAPTLIAFLTK